MNECWNFFRYATMSDLEEILHMVNSNIQWFSHLHKEHFIKKIQRRECIYESGVMITFKILNSKKKLGTFEVPAGNTIIEQLIKNKKKSNSNLLFHVVTKFFNCASGSVYLAVNNKNHKAIKFYNKMNMIKIANTKLDNKNNECVKGLIFKTVKKYLGRSIN